jgi:hypothetical protein
MFRRAISPLLAAIVAVGCSRTPPALDPNALAPDERAAVDLAVRFEKEQRLGWGRPIAIHSIGPGWEPILGDGPGRYNVVFPTPDREIPTLGDRAILVNAKSGQAIVVPRE